MESKGRGGVLDISLFPRCQAVCATAQGDAMEAVKRFLFFYLPSKFSPLKVGDVFLEHTSVASHALAAFGKKKKCLAFEQFDPTSPWLKSQHDCTYHPACWSCGVFLCFRRAFGAVFLLQFWREGRGASETSFASW